MNILASYSTGDNDMQIMVVIIWDKQYEIFVTDDGNPILNNFLRKYPFGLSDSFNPFLIKQLTAIIIPQKVDIRTDKFINKRATSSSTFITYKNIAVNIALIEFIVKDTIKPIPEYP